MSLLGIGQQEEVGVTEILGPVQVAILPTDKSLIHKMVETPGGTEFWRWSFNKENMGEIFAFNINPERTSPPILAFTHPELNAIGEALGYKSTVVCIGIPERGESDHLLYPVIQVVGVDNDGMESIFVGQLDLPKEKGVPMPVPGSPFQVEYRLGEKDNSYYVADMAPVFNKALGRPRYDSFRIALMQLGVESVAELKVDSKEGVKSGKGFAIVLESK